MKKEDHVVQQGNTSFYMVHGTSVKRYHAEYWIYPRYVGIDLSGRWVNVRRQAVILKATGVQTDYAGIR